MGPVMDLNERRETAMEASSSKDHMVFVSMQKDRNINAGSKREGMEVDIIDCKNDDEGGSVQPQSDDATASSSSFDDTYPDRGTCGFDSDSDVMSNLRGDAAPMQGYGGSGDVLPLSKKRVSSHWRKYVQPIMWRCKWVELQLRKFKSMAIMYDKEIEKHNQTKELKYKDFELEGRCAKSLPYIHDSPRHKPMKRKIRKRHEESVTEVCMLQHNISSYFATCKSPAHGPTMNDDQTNLAPSSPKNTGNERRVADELLSLDFRDGYSLEQILWKIEVSQSQVSKMKNRLDTITTENAKRISSTEAMILHEPDKALTCPVSESDFPTDMEGPSTAATFASQLMKLNTHEDVVKPENVASELSHVQDADEPTERPCVATRKQSVDGILIYNRRAKKPRMNAGIVNIHPIEKLRISEEENNSNDTTPVLVFEDSSQNEQPAPKIRSMSKLITPKSKKKRAARTRRKSGSSLWSRRTSG